MKPTLPTSSCRCCRCYVPEGRRGGQCEQLGVPVQGHWTACPLALPPFAPSWEGLFNTAEENWSIKVVPLARSRHLETASLAALDTHEELVAANDVA